MESPFEPQSSQALPSATFRDYLNLLLINKSYACLVLAEVLVLLGYYLSYIAILSIITEYGGGGATLLSVLSLLQSLPAFFWFPVTGAVADRCGQPLYNSTVSILRRFDRHTVLAAVPLTCAAIVLGFSLITGASLLWCVSTPLCPRTTLTGCCLYWYSWKPASMLFTSRPERPSCRSWCRARSFHWLPPSTPLYGAW